MKVTRYVCNNCKLYVANAPNKLSNSKRDEDFCNEQCQDEYRGK